MFTHLNPSQSSSTNRLCAEDKIMIFRKGEVPDEYKNIKRKPDALTCKPPWGWGKVNISVKKAPQVPPISQVILDEIASIGKKIFG